MTEFLILACPACSTLNRFPRDKLAAGNAWNAASASGSPLFADIPSPSSAKTFEAHAAKSATFPLRDFPIDFGRNRWDRMLAPTTAERWAPNDRERPQGSLEAHSGRARARRLPSQRPGAGRRVYAALASQTLKAIELGGAYCNLLALVRELLTASQPIAEAGQNSPSQANLRYRNIAGRLAALKPDRSTF